jgi:hypothetical protein
MFIKKIIFFFTFLCVGVTNCYAYLGPGMGGGTIIAVLAFILAIVVLLFSILIKPIRLLKKVLVKLFNKFFK